MTREEILNSVALKKRFCKDLCLPISIFDNPYFEGRLSALSLTDRHKDCMNKFEKFCIELEGFQCVQDYFEEYNRIKDAVINAIKGNEKYKLFINTMTSSFLYEYSLNRKMIKEGEFNSKKYSRRTLYSSDNDGEYFISIDMEKANFTALRYFSPEIFNNEPTWEQYLANFTDLVHILDSKYIRQVIFGACNPKVQVQYEQFLMRILADYIVEKTGIEIYSMDADELIIKIKSGGLGVSLNELRDIIAREPNGIGNLVRVEYFHLESIGSTGGWLKINDEKEDFKCLSPEIYHQIILHYYGHPISESDLVFSHNGRLAKFLEEVENPWEE